MVYATWYSQRCLEASLHLHGSETGTGFSYGSFAWIISSAGEITQIIFLQLANSLQ